MATKEGDPILDNLEASPEEEEITLSDTELDDVLNSAEITTDAGEDTLEQYGVWVKAEPQEVDAPGEADLDFELADLGPGEVADLTEEEEQLLGELEGESETGEGLSILEDDLEELGKGAEEREAAAGDTLEVDIEDLGTAVPSTSEEPEELQLDEMPEDFPDLEAETLEGLDSLDTGATTAAEGEIEVPLSDRSAVEEHYEELAPLEGVPSTPGMSPPNILERIEKDLNQIKSEIQSLKNELAGFAGGASRRADVKPAPATAGSFEKGEDDTIALTGDELDNILNTADITEETAEPAEAESLEDLDELDSLQSPEEMTMDLESEEPAGLTVDLYAAAEPGPAPGLSLDEDILEPGALDLPEELSAEGPDTLAGLESAADESLGELSLEDESIPELTDEISLDEADELSPLENLETLEELEIPEAGAEQAAEGLDLELPGESTIEELTLEEPQESAVEDLGLEGPEEAGIEELGLAEEPVAETLGELEAGDEIPEIELAGEQSEPAQAGETEELELVEEADGPEDLEIPRGAAERPGPAGQGGVAALPKDLQSDIRSVLSYLDQLLEALPDEKIQEFAQSQYFGIYKRLFDELGLGA